jgi:carbon-monoxide dehydrogenase large subunit
LPYGTTFEPAAQRLLSFDAAHIGEPIAMVVSYDPYLGVDAAALVEIEYEDRPVATWESVQQPGGPEAHAGHSNIVGGMAHEAGEVDKALARAEHVIDMEFEFQSLKSMAIECRGCAANWDAVTRTLSVRSTNQTPYMLRSAVARMLALREEQVRVQSQDVGGSFGLKGRTTPEEILVCMASMKLALPLRWAETRLEHMLAANHNGRQKHWVRVGFSSDGLIRALDLRLIKEVGAYNHFNMMLPSNTVNHLTTHYKVPAIRLHAEALSTNTSPCSPYRGAGRVEATFTMDRVLDAIARRIDVDPLVVRQRNLVTVDDLPYRNGLIYRDNHPVEYRDTDFGRLLEVASQRLDYWGWREKQKALKAEGRMVGIGISSYVEGGGIGPCESAEVKVEQDGSVTVLIGVNTQGQSHETTIAQVCADALDLPMHRVRVRNGDTDLLPMSFGANASRTAVNVGNAAHLACGSLLEKVKTLAAAILDVPVADIDYTQGVALVCGTERSITLAQLSVAGLRHPVMRGIGGGALSAFATFYPRTVTWSAGVNMAAIEIDRDTGRPIVLKYVFAHDCGLPINPAVVDGQIHGGFAQGVGIALGEEHLYDSQGQVLTGSLMNYYVPRAADVPRIEIEHLSFPSQENPLGIKGTGESGPNAPPAVFAAAVEDALDAAMVIDKLPISWDAVLRVLAEREEAR